MSDKERKMAMDEVNYEEIKLMTEKQEKALRFEHFSNKDALELGTFITNKIYEENMALAVAIRRMNGTIIYQHLTDGTNHINQNWMERKFNTVSYFERSSLGAWALEALSGETVDVHGLSKEDFVFVGGGFPIRLKTGEIVAVLTVSNLPHMEDHRFIIRVLSEYLGEKM